MYSSIYKIWSEENYLEDIQKLNDQILENIRKYIKLRRELKNKTNEEIVKLLIEEEIENVNFMLQDLIKLRTIKIFDAIQKDKKININYLTSEERKFYESTQELYKRNADFFSLAQDVSSKNSDNYFNQYIPIRITKEMNAIVGADLKTYGPFRPEDIVVLPKKNAESLIKHDYASAISVKKEKLRDKR